MTDASLSSEAIAKAAAQTMATLQTYEQALTRISENSRCADSRKYAFKTLKDIRNAYAK